jgi:hypothetical protein
MLEINEWKLRPKEAITKEEFLYLSYMILKLNACEIEISDDIALKIDVYNSSCKQWDIDCNLSDLKSTDDTYDFEAKSKSDCIKAIDTELWYTWWFLNMTNWENFIKYWKYLDNIKFQNSWIWKINLKVRDNCSKESEVFLYINVWNNNTMLGLNIKSSYIKFNKWSEVKFESIISSW